MHVGVDGRVLTLIPTGLAQYTVNLLRQMSRLSDHTWTVFAPGPLSVDLTECPNTSVLCGSLKNPMTILAWQQFVLPARARKHGVEVFWSPHHYLPSLPGIPMVCTIHDLVWASGLNDMRAVRRLSESFLMPLAVRRARALIAVSEATKVSLNAQIPASKGKVTVIHEGPVPLPLPSIQSLEAFGIRGPYILFVGTRQQRKNLQRLVEAFRVLPPELRSDCQLVLTGEELRPGNDGLGTAEIHSDPQIVVTGFVSPEVLSLLYDNARVFAMPSLIEGFGLPLLEAMAKGVPILTSDQSSMPEVAQGAAVLVDPLDVQSIAAGLQSLLVDEQLRNNLSALGRQRVLDFSWETAAKLTLEVLQEAVTST